MLGFLQVLWFPLQSKRPVKKKKESPNIPTNEIIKLKENKMRRSGFEFTPIMSHTLHNYKGDRGQSDSRVQTRAAIRS